MSTQERAYRKWLLDRITKYRPILFLEKYDIEIEKKNEARHYLSCFFHYPYLHTIIYYSDRAIGDWKKDRHSHEKRIVHELCHIVTDPFYAMACERYGTKEHLEEARERLTDHIAMIVVQQHL